MRPLRAILFHGGVRAAVWWVGPLLILLGVACVIAQLGGVGISALTHDPNSLRGAPFYAGFVSNVGVMLWAATAGICFFAAGVSRGRKPGGRAFFLLGGLLTALLLLDDLFMIHQDVFAGILGIPEPLTYFAYAAAAGGYLVAFHRRILASHSAPLAAALGLFGVSVVLDVALPTWELPEDGAKLLGIGCWSAYFVTTAAVEVRAVAIEADLTALAADDAGTAGEPALDLESATTALAALAELAREAGDWRERSRGPRLPDIDAVVIHPRPAAADADALSEPRALRDWAGRAAP